MNDFDKTVKRIEQELLDLKTASEYSSTRSASFGSVNTVSTGLYRITYAPGNEAIMATAFCEMIIGTDLYGSARLRTPENGSQVVEVNTNYRNFDTQQMVVGEATLRIISNRLVTSIARI